MKLDLQPNLVRGRITEVSDVGVKIDFNGRMGALSIPRRSVITDKAIEINDEIEIYISYAQIICK